MTNKKDMLIHVHSQLHIWACSKIMKPKRDIGVKNETVVIGEIVIPNKLGVLKVFKIV